MKKYQQILRPLKYALSLSLCFFVTSNVLAQSDKELVGQTVTKNKIEGHIHFLAADELRGREVGTPEIDIAAKYIATSFMKYGVEQINGSYYQNVPLVKNIPPSTYALKVNGSAIDFDDIMYLTGENINTTTEYVYVGEGTQKEFEKKKLEGKIAVTIAGSQEKNDMNMAFQKMNGKAKRAEEAGAIGLIELFDKVPKQWSRYKSYFTQSTFKIAQQDDEEDFITMWVVNNNELIKDKSKSSASKMEVTINGKMQLEINSKNVVGMVQGTDSELKDEYIIYSAHYDHNGVGEPNAEGDSIYNGARDNAVGVVTVMSAAESIAKNPTKRSALFILFTAEEKGLLGSKYYVENPLIPLNQMVYCFNSDNGGYNDTSIATIVGLGRTTAEKHIIEAAQAFGLKAIDDPAGEQGLFDRSDNVNFAKKGIPAPTFSLGFTAFDQEILKYYHQTADNPEGLDYDYLDKFFKAYVMACRLIANDPVTPFWLEGDKYYEAGKMLYKNK